jgi:hypothetical protein
MLFRLLTAAAAASCAAAAALAVTGPALPAKAAACSNPVMLGPATPINLHNGSGTWTYGYLYVGWYANCQSTYAEVDWRSGWQNAVTGSVYLNWNAPGHNSAEGTVNYPNGGIISWKSANLYQGLGNPYSAGRSFTAAIKVTFHGDPNGWSCGPIVLTGNTHDFSNGGNSGVGDGTCYASGI